MGTQGSPTQDLLVGTEVQHPLWLALGSRYFFTTSIGGRRITDYLQGGSSTVMPKVQNVHKHRLLHRAGFPFLNFVLPVRLASAWQTAMAAQKSNWRALWRNLQRLLRERVAFALDCKGRVGILQAKKSRAFGKGNAAWYIWLEPREYFWENGEVATHNAGGKITRVPTTRRLGCFPKSSRFESFDCARMLSWGVIQPDDCIRKITMGAIWRQGEPNRPRRQKWGLTLFLPENVGHLQSGRSYLMERLDKFYKRQQAGGSSKMAKSWPSGFVSRKPSSQLTCTHSCHNSPLIQQIEPNISCDPGAGFPTGAMEHQTGPCLHSRSLWPWEGSKVLNR